MKVFQIITEAVNGGAEAIVWNIHRELLRTGADSTIVYICGDKKVQTGPEISLGANKVYSIFTFLKIATFLLKLPRGAILHTHLSVAQLAAVFFYPILLFKKIKLLTTIHSEVTRRDKSFLGRSQNRILFKLCNKVICVSRKVEKNLLSLYKIQNTRVIENGILETSDRSPSDYSNEIKILALSRLEPGKNVERVIRLFLQKKDPRFSLTIAGTGSHEERLRNIVIESQDNRISFLGHVPAANNCYRSHHVFINLSKHEGFGLTNIEAMSHGMPVIMSNIETFRCLFKNYPSRLFVDDDFDLFELCAYIESNHDLIRKESLEASALFSLDKTIRELRSTYTQEL